MKVIVSRRAELDMSEIATWIALDNPRAADRMIDRLVAAASALTRHSLCNPKVIDTYLRKRPVGAYIIFSRVDDAVSIARILHAARDRPSMLDET